MSTACGCTQQHRLRRVVLTGGPGAGKTAVLEMLAHELCPHVVITREAAGILFAGGFPRDGDPRAHRAVQRAIYHVQAELETLVEGSNHALALFDRGVVDGSAYWPGPDDFWSAVGTSRIAALNRYDAVIHLRSPNGPNGYGHQNPLRVESAAEAQRIDQRILEAWEGHPRRFIVDAMPDFREKAARALELIHGEIPPCCRIVQRATTSTGHSAPATTDPRTLPRKAGSMRPIP